MIIWHTDSKYKTKGETKSKKILLVQLWFVFVEVNVACIKKILFIWVFIAEG